MSSVSFTVLLNYLLSRYHQGQTTGAHPFGTSDSTGIITIRDVLFIIIVLHLTHLLACIIMQCERCNIFVEYYELGGFNFIG